MKATILKLAQPHRRLITLSFLVTLAIWFLGPALSIGSYTPLESIEKRCYLIVALAIVGLLIFLFYEPKPKKILAAPLSPEAAKKLKTLQGRFQGAVDFLKKTTINKHGSETSLARLPWFLFIGTQGSGKTTLLANANINYILAKQYNPNNLQLAPAIPASSHCDWWVSRESVLVDVPGNYLADKSPQRQQYAALLWRHLLQLLKPNSAANKLHGVVITLQLPELNKKNSPAQKTQLIANLKQRISELREQFGEKLPFYLVITKCDLVPGFSEFFSETGSDELAQAWGVTLPALSPKDRLLEIFNQRFDALIKRLNKQLIWRLHHERNSQLRPAIKDFPLHIERLKNSISHFLKNTISPDLPLQGVYLTSAIQPTTSSSSDSTYLNTSTTSLAHSMVQSMTTARIPKRAYFIRQLLLQGLSAKIIPTQKNKTLLKTWQQPRWTYVAASTALVIFAGLLGYDFEQNMQKSYAIHTDLAQYDFYLQQPQNSNDRLTKALPLLNALAQATQNAGPKISLLNLSAALYSRHAAATPATIYQHALKNIVIPDVKNYLENYLQTNTNKNPDRTYAVLKAYLMLNDKTHLEANYLAEITNQLLPTQLSKVATNDLATHLNAALATATPVTLNSDLIANSKKQLKSLSPLELAVVILKNTHNNNIENPILLGTNLGNPPIFVSSAIASRTPQMYTGENFPVILKEDMQAAATAALNGNWVLGDLNAEQNISTAHVAALSDQLRNRYINNYVDVWESLIANIKPYTPKNLSATDQMIATLMSDNSPLLQLLQTIKQNTNFGPILSHSPKIQNLNHLLADSSVTTDNTLYQIFTALRELHGYLQPLIADNTNGDISFRTAATRMQNSTNDPITRLHQLAQKTPEPMKTWLNNIADQSWNFILAAASEHINNAWQSQIVPVYTADIANHYPLAKNATQEISLANFTNFFSPNGKLNTFYQTNLKSFVNDSTKPWQWKLVDNHKLAFSNTSLYQIQHAALIAETFFPHGENKLQLEFNLKAVALDSSLKAFAVNINGQNFNYQNESSTNIIWPGDGFQRTASLSFTTLDNQVLKQTATGDWAWFKLINAATQHLNNSQELSVAFSDNGRAVKYLLQTQSKLNPFSPLSLTRFNLPLRLLTTSDLVG
jgi:type VI secretion system protein ImpL